MSEERKIPWYSSCESFSDIVIMLWLSGIIFRPRRIRRILSFFNISSKSLSLCRDKTKDSSHFDDGWKMIVLYSHLVNGSRVLLSELNGAMHPCDTLKTFFIPFSVNCFFMCVLKTMKKLSFESRFKKYFLILNWKSYAFAWHIRPICLHSGAIPRLITSVLEMSVKSYREKFTLTLIYNRVKMRKNLVMMGDFRSLESHSGMINLYIFSSRDMEFLTRSGMMTCTLLPEFIKADMCIWSKLICPNCCI